MPSSPHPHVLPGRLQAPKPLAPGAGPNSPCCAPHPCPQVLGGLGCAQGLELFPREKEPEPAHAQGKGLVACAPIPGCRVPALGLGGGPQRSWPQPLQQVWGGGAQHHPHTHGGGEPGCSDPWVPTPPAHVGPPPSP